MKLKTSYTLLSLLAAALPASAVEQVLLDWGADWAYFHPMSDDPGADDAAIPNAGDGAAPNAGPDLIHTSFDSGPGAWFAPEAEFISATGYQSVFARGFDIDGSLTGNPANYSSYDGGRGPGPFGFGAIVYFASGPEFLMFGTTLTTTPANRKWASYYRTTFTTTQDHTKPRVRILIDDNAVIFIDGVLVARVNRTNNLLTYNDTGNSDTTATNNENGNAAGNEDVIQSFRLDQAGGPAPSADSFVVAVLPKLPAGERTIAVMVRNSGGNSSDKVFGMQLLGDDAGLSAAVSNVTRNDNGTILDVSDDTYSFDVNVTTINLPDSTTWTSDAAAPNPVTGIYSVSSTFTYPAQANSAAPVNTNTITFTDSVNTLVTTSVTVTAPESPNGAPLVLAPATPMFSTGFEEPPVTTQNHNRKVYHTELGFTSTAGSGPQSPGGTTLPGGVYQDAASVTPETNKSWRAVNGTCALTTEAIGLDPSVKGVQVTMKARAFTTSGTSFETADAISLGVETSTDGITWTLRGNVLPMLNGSPDATANQAADRIVNLLGDDASSVNNGAYITLSRETVPVSGGTSVRLRYTNAADLSTSENILLDDLKIEIASADPDADSDNDGATNSQEEEWGSDRGDPASRPGYLSHSIRPGANPGETVQRLEFSTGGPFHSYSVRASDDLVTWADTPPYPGIDDVQVHEDTGTGSRRFFQIRSNY